MARFVDLDEEDAHKRDSKLMTAQELAKQFEKLDAEQADGSTALQTAPFAEARATDEHSNKAASKRPEEVCNAVTKAFQCYPIADAIASHLDVNTLDALSRTCQNIHSGLLQYRKSLLRITLRCNNDALPVDPDQVLRFRARQGIHEATWEMQGRVEGKSGQCATDMVGECRRCGIIVCRNCAIKPPASGTFRDRHRRLCKACSSMPVAMLACPKLYPVTTDIGAAIFEQSICRCIADGVHLCRPCGRGIRAEDDEYRKVWKWRLQYGDRLGGLGTGIGDGDRAQICARNGSCVAAREQAHEVDCDAEDARYPSSSTASPSTMSLHSHVSTPNYNTANNNNNNPLDASSLPAGFSVPDASASSPAASQSRAISPQLGPGYARHEIEGIGGVVKTKLLRMVKVGACVPEWGDEARVKNILGREADGRCRSWCGWCQRVIPGPDDGDIYK